MRRGRGRRRGRATSSSAPLEADPDAGRGAHLRGHRLLYVDRTASRSGSIDERPRLRHRDRVQGRGRRLARASRSPRATSTTERTRARSPTTRSPRSSSSRPRRSRPRSPPRDVDAGRRAGCSSRCSAGRSPSRSRRRCTATADTASVELAAMVDSGDPDSRTESVAARPSLPGGSWLAVAVPDLGPTLERAPRPALEQRPARAPGEIERQVARARPGSTSRADVVRLARRRGGLRRGHRGARVQRRADRRDRAIRRARARCSRSLQSARRARLRAALRRPPGGRRRTASRSASRGSAAAPRRAWSATSSSRWSARPSTQALDPSETLGDDPALPGRRSTSLGDDLPPALYRRPAGVLRRSPSCGGSTATPDYEAIRPYLDAFDSLVAGSRVERRARGHPAHRCSLTPTSSVPGAMSRPRDRHRPDRDRAARARARAPAAAAPSASSAPASSRTRAGAARPGRHLAARFAAKEAALKALGLGGLRLHEVEVEGGGDEPPRLRLHGDGGRAAAEREGRRARGLAQPLARARGRRGRGRARLTRRARG